MSSAIKIVAPSAVTTSTPSSSSSNTAAAATTTTSTGNMTPLSAASVAKAAVFVPGAGAGGGGGGGAATSTVTSTAMGVGAQEFIPRREQTPTLYEDGHYYNPAAANSNRSVGASTPGTSSLGQAPPLPAPPLPPQSHHHQQQHGQMQMQIMLNGAGGQAASVGEQQQQQQGLAEYYGQAMDLNAGPPLQGLYDPSHAHHAQHGGHGGYGAAAGPPGVGGDPYYGMGVGAHNAFVRQPLLYHLYHPLPSTTSSHPTAHPLPSFFLPPALHISLTQKQEAMHATASHELKMKLPEEVSGYVGLVLLDSGKGQQQGQGQDAGGGGGSGFGGYRSWVYKAWKEADGRCYALRRIEGFRLQHEAAISVIEKWTRIRHPGLVAVREAFTTRAFGDQSLVVVHDYYPCSTTLYEAHLSPTASLPPNPWSTPFNHGQGHGHHGHLGHGHPHHHHQQQQSQQQQQQQGHHTHHQHHNPHIQLQLPPPMQHHMQHQQQHPPHLQQQQGPGARLRSQGAASPAPGPGPGPPTPSAASPTSATASNPSGIGGGGGGGGIGVSERVLWSYIVQLGAVIKAVHNSGLAVRTLEPARVLLTGKNRIRVGGCGVGDVVGWEAGVMAQQGQGQLMGAGMSPQMVGYQQDDLLSFGKLIISLCCGSTSSVHNLPKSVDHIARVYSPDLKNVVLYLLSKPGPRKTVEEVLALMGGRVLDELNASFVAEDTLEAELMRELENGRLVRLMAKFGFINERREFDHDPRWAETGDRYIIKLFRDYVFHQVDENGRPVTDLSHVVTCLNKLDAGVDEKIMLVSRDEQSCLIVSYREIKNCIEGAFLDLSR